MDRSQHAQRVAHFTPSATGRRLKDITLPIEIRARREVETMIRVVVENTYGYRNVAAVLTPGGDAGYMTWGHAEVRHFTLTPPVYG